MRNLIIKIIGSAFNVLSCIAPKYAANKALNLFATPRKGHFLDNQKKVVAKAKVNTLSYNNLNINTYQWQGKGKTILLIHGWESNTSRWQYILKDLIAQQYNVIALDAPAHGQSGGKQFNAILYSEFINVVANTYKPEVLIGHSVGGMASVFYMHNYKPNFINKLVLLGAPAHFTGVFNRYKQMMGFNKRVAKGLDAIVLERFHNPVSYFSASEFTKTITAKGLIIHDENDIVIPYSDALLFQKNYKNAKLITTKGFGHGLKDKSLTPKIITFINNEMI